MKKVSNDKYEFFENFWRYILNNWMDIYSGSYLIDLVMLIGEIKLLLDSSEPEQYKINDLVTIFSECQIYMRKNFYYKNEYMKEIRDLQRISNKVGQLNLICLSKTKNDKYKEINKIFKYVNNNMSTINGTYIKINNINNIDKISKCIKKEILSNKSLIASRSKLQSLEIDYICMLLRSGNEIDYLKSEIFKPCGKWINTENSILNSKFNSFINFADNENKQFTYIFKVLRLKIQKPYEMKDILFYNPLREDLLELIYNKKILMEEEKFFSDEELKIFRDIRKGQLNSQFENPYVTENIDAHVRVEVKAHNISEGKCIAIQKISDIINILKYNYDLFEIKISNEFCAILTETQEFYHNYAGFKKDKNISTINYVPDMLNRELIKDLRNDESTLNKILNINDEQIRKNFQKSINWYIKGKQIENTDEKFICYWIALEFMVNKKGDSRSKKKKVIEIGNAIFILTKFKSELRFLHEALVNQFYASYNIRRRLPEEISKIKGMDKFNIRVERYTLAQNLKLFRKYPYNEFINYKREKFIQSFESCEHQHRVIEMMNENYKNILARIYRIRNSIMHNAMINNNDIKIYGIYLEILCGNLLCNIIDGAVDNQKTWDYAYIEEKYKEWMNRIFNGQYIKII